MSDLHSLPVTAADGSQTDLSAWRGRVMLIVNVASKCGFTPQYAGLEALYRAHAAEGLVVIGFPCNQFGGQEPGSAAEIATFCSTSYDVTFPIMGKVDVNGADAAPVWRHLKKEAPGLLGSEAIKWNFTKFLIDRNGRVVARYAPTTTPQAIEPDIQQLLQR
ncbi:glutathione peroxidase [Sphingomonas sp. IW22]|uniref:glutathione peroxidase n=1 Tax=Sphingomonas sp. IW22 TaxID=3242489 RepID=UPI0035229161